MIRLRFLIAYFLLVTVVLQSCLSEDELGFPDESADTLTVTSSVAVQSLLRVARAGTLSANEPCTEFFYPLHLGFNNGLTISVNNLEGLIEVAESGSAGQHVDGIVFPFLVSKANSIRNIENENDFITLMEDCDYLTLRDEFDLFYTQCFDFEYPIRMIDKEGGEVVIGSQEEYFAFELLQGFEEQPVFVFPLSIEVFSDDRVAEVTNNFELFEIFDTCERCPQLSFDTDFAGGTSYVFTADFPGRDDLFSYDWFINDDFIETDGTGVQGDHTLSRTFDPGGYEVCIRAITDDCVVGVEYCEFLEVEDPCPELFFETAQINDVTYKFTATFPLKDEIVYSWNIFREDMLIFSEVEDEVGDNKLEFQFDPGAYEICLRAEVEGCPEVVWFCDDIVIE